MAGTLVSTGSCTIEFCHFPCFHWQCLFRCFFIIGNNFLVPNGACVRQYWTSFYIPV